MSYLELNYLSTDIETRIVVVTNLQLIPSRGGYNKFHRWCSFLILLSGDIKTNLRPIPSSDNASQFAIGT